MRTYTTVQGDMWDAIAYTQLGSTNLKDKLMAANLQYRNYFTFPAGIVLVLPDIPKEISGSLPPWKQVGHK